MFLYVLSCSDHFPIVHFFSLLCEFLSSFFSSLFFIFSPFHYIPPFFPTFDGVYYVLFSSISCFSSVLFFYFHDKQLILFTLTML